MIVKLLDFGMLAGAAASADAMGQMNNACVVSGAIPRQMYFEIFPNDRNKKKTNQESETTKNPII